MSYQEKRIISSIVTGLLIFIAYCIYANDMYQSGTEDLRSWASMILVFVGVGVVVTIIIQIVFHILIAVSIAVKEKMVNSSCDDKDIEKSIKNEMVTDEMDNLIELKSMRMGYVIAGVGIVMGLLSLVLNYSPVIMLNIIFISCNVGSLLEGFTQLYYYRRGI